MMTVNTIIKLLYKKIKFKKNQDRVYFLSKLHIILLVQFYMLHVTNTT